MKNIFLLKGILPILICIISIPAFSKIVLPEIFSDNMVLQQQTEAPVWGKASPNKNVKIITSWNKQAYTTRSGTDGKMYKPNLTDGKFAPLKQF